MGDVNIIASADTKSRASAMSVLDPRFELANNYGLAFRRRISIL
jgi:hypothetical protein